MNTLMNWLAGPSESLRVFGKYFVSELVDQ
jgi:hypothetical protein